MILAVDAGSPVPVYEQVRQQVTRMALAGTLAPGQRLPTIRQLASDLGLAKGTVARAYELLEADRIIETQGRKGSFVTEPPTAAAPPMAGTEQAADLAQAADALVVVARQLGLDLTTTHRAIDEAWDRFS
jgi:DNA-binding transcriptional regulator YhcF (GntR family)